MLNRISRAFAFAIVFAAPTGLAAQAQSSVMARAASPSAASEANARAWYSELQRIGARLQAAHNRVMQQNPQLRTAQESFFRDVQAAMQRQDPGLDAIAARIPAMQQEGAAAMRRGDRARLAQLNTDMARIQERFAAAQRAVLAQPALKRRAAEIERQLHTYMLQAEPETDRLMDRGKELQQRLMQATQGGARPRQ